jgi:hypothetical protein
MLNEEYVPFPPSVQQTADGTSVRTYCVSLPVKAIVSIYYASLVFLYLNVNGSYINYLI